MRNTVVTHNIKNIAPKQEKKTLSISTGEGLKRDLLEEQLSSDGESDGTKSNDQKESGHRRAHAMLLLDILSLIRLPAHDEWFILRLYLCLTHKTSVV